MRMRYICRCIPKKERSLTKDFTLRCSGKLAFAFWRNATGLYAKVESLWFHDNSFFILFRLLNSPFCISSFSFSGVKSNTTFFQDIIRRISSLTLSTLILDIILKVSTFRLRKIVEVLLLFLSFVVFIGDCFSLAMYECLISWEMIVIIAASTKAESVNFLSTYLPDPRFLSYIGAIALASMILFIIDRKIIFRVPSISRVLLTFYTLSALYFNDKHLETISLIRFRKMLLRASKDISITRKLQQKFEKPSIHLMENNSTIPLFVLILGESTSRTHMSLYNYPLQTTPLLKQRAISGDIILFSDVVSPARQTQASLQKLFTFQNWELGGQWYEFNTIFDVLNAAGYRTVWISNQEPYSVYATTATVLAGRCQERYYTYYSAAYVNGPPFDEALFPLIEKRLLKATIRRHQGSKTFAVVHLMGTHLRYARRFPKQFGIFTFRNENGTSRRVKTKRADYDNAILYNDYVVDGILKRLSSKSVVVLYLSDHGEEVYDNPKNLYLGHDERRSTNYMIEIPFIFWFSQQFRKRYPAVVDAVQKAKDRPYMTDDLIHTILDILRIRTVEFEKERSIINSDFQASRKRICHGKEYHR